MLLSHAKAWHTYDQEFRATQQGKVSIILNTHWGEPKTDKQADIDAAERSIEWWLGWFANPIFINGDWPDVMKRTVKKNSKTKGIPNRYEGLFYGTRASRCYMSKPRENASLRVPNPLETGKFSEMMN